MAFFNSKEIRPSFIYRIVPYHSSSGGAWTDFLVMPSSKGTIPFVYPVDNMLEFPLEA